MPYSGVKHLYLPGTSSNFASVPDAAALDITGDLDIRIDVAATDWTPAAAQALVSKWTEGGNQRSYRLQIIPAGSLQLGLSSNGTAVASASSAATGLTDGSRKWVRVTWRQSDGRVQFFTSDDGTTWAQLGVDSSIAIASIHSGSSPFGIGGRSAGGLDPLEGKVYRARVFASVDGTDERLNANFATAVFNATRSSCTVATGQTVTLSRSTSGRHLEVVDRDLFHAATDDRLNIVSPPALSYPFTLFACGRYYGTIGDVLFGYGHTSLANNVVAMGYTLNEGKPKVLKRLAADEVGATHPNVAATGTDYVIAGVYGSATDLRLYVDGVLITSNTTSMVLPTLDVAHMFSRSNGGVFAYFTGSGFAWAVFSGDRSADIATITAELL